MGSYSLQQQVFAVSLLANAASSRLGLVGPLENRISAMVEAFFGKSQVQGYMGEWSVVWGPVVSAPGVLSRQLPIFEGNAMFVARGTDASGNPVYVVAVAGTNPLSKYDVSTEDFDTTLVPWTPVPAGAGTPHVTQGTLDGVQALLAMSDSGTGTLQAYLAGVAEGSATLVFTGHSLGGALAPALALALFADPASGALNAEDWGAVRVYPVAAPTVGDQDYAQMWTSVFPEAQDAAGERWNLLVWNSMDVVPRAWAQLGTLSTLYPASMWNQCLGQAQAALQQHAQAAGGPFSQPQNQELAGTFAPLAQPGGDVVANFVAEALHQHVWAYFDLLNVPEVRPLLLPAGDPAQNPISLEIDAAAGLLKSTFCSSTASPPGTRQRHARQSSGV